MIEIRIQLFRESLGQTLPAERSRRGARPTIRQVALAKLKPATAGTTSSPTVDRILAQTLQRLRGPSPGAAPQA